MPLPVSAGGGNDGGSVLDGPAGAGAGSGGGGRPARGRGPPVRGPPPSGRRRPKVAGETEADAAEPDRADMATARRVASVRRGRGGGVAPGRPVFLGERGVPTGMTRLHGP